ncbi:hypothetical protein D0Z00_003606 [Geotrichum galactomycetum]|uniref:Uncharacterized protein n=1 Tax=Geotrichum galactomycetum TaxID=27317 RepID=A0ACB6V0P7_9ASCO|nr:hypothetical protein D0Z00_003606 [Geotrichum candidum]
MTTTKRKTNTSDLPEGVDKQNHSIYNSKPSSPIEESSDAANHAPEDHTFVPKHHPNPTDITNRNKKPSSFLAFTHHVYSLVKNTVPDLSATVFGLVVTVSIMLLIITNSSLFSTMKPLAHPVPGLTSKFSVVDTPFIIPDLVGKHRKDSGSTQQTGPKKAPGDFVIDTDDKPRPAAAAAAASKTVQSDLAAAAAVSLDSTDYNSVVYIDNPDKTPPLIIVTAIDTSKFKPDYVQAMIENRRAYAALHGFGLYIRYVSDFDEWKSSNNKSPGWAKVAVLRAALHAFPHAHHFWYLDQHGLIVNPTINVLENIIEPEALGKLMLRDEPISPDSPVHTYKNTVAAQTKFIISHNPTEGLNPASFIIANIQLDAGQYAHSLLDYWNDPLTRNYQSFENGDSSALTHIMTWHPAYLSRMAVIPVRAMAGYRLILGLNDMAMSPEVRDKMVHQPEDFVALLVACETGSSTYCLQDVANVLNHQAPTTSGEELSIDKDHPQQPVEANKNQPAAAAAEKNQ